MMPPHEQSRRHQAVPKEFVFLGSARGFDTRGFMKKQSSFRGAEKADRHSQTALTARCFHRLHRGGRVVNPNRVRIQRLGALSQQLRERAVNIRGGGAIL